MATIMRIGGGGGEPNVLTVAVDTGAIVTATNGDKTVVATSVGGKAVLKLPKAGTWRIVASKDGQTTEDVITISDDYPVEVSFGLPLSSLAEGALIKLNENGSGVNFYLAKHDYESDLNGIGRELLVRKDCHSNQVWGSNAKNVYADNTIDVWLNNTYKTYLDSKVQDLISTTNFKCAAGNKTSTVNTIARAVFLPSLYELGAATSMAPVDGSALPIASTLKIAYMDGSAVTQWTRSVSSGNYESACRIFYDSRTGFASVTESLGARPCFTLPSNARVNPAPNADGSYTLLV